MDFSDMLYPLKDGAKMKRDGWVRQYIFLDDIDGVITLQLTTGHPIVYRPTSLDLLADDWEEVA